jgi:hypothetical protein
VPSALVLAAFAVAASATAAEPPAPLPNALLRQESDGPPPPAVNQPVRVRQALRPGTTYEVRLKGTMKVDAVYEPFVPLLNIRGKITVNYAFEAVIERTIWYNDGARVIEDRYFRDVKTLLVGSDAEDLTLTPGPAGQALLDLSGVAVPFVPGGAAVKGGEQLLQVVLKHLGPFLANVHQRVRSGYRVGAFAMLDGLSGKKVRLHYVDGRGVQRLEPVWGAITPDERSFHMSSVVLSDCLLFPNEELPVGDSYEVDAEAFGDKIDPSFRTRLGGTVQVTRAADKSFYVPALADHRMRCAVLKVSADGLQLRSAAADVGAIVGTFSPTGVLYFDPGSRLVVAAQLKGSGEVKTFPPRHLMHKAHSFSRPQLDIVYSCRVLAPPPEEDR